MHRQLKARTSKESDGVRPDAPIARAKKGTTMAHSNPYGIGNGHFVAGRRRSRGTGIASSPLR